MKLIMSEYSSGFADYSYLLCNELAKDKEIDELIYLTDANNFYIPNIDQRVHAIKLFRCFSADDRHKKGNIRWLFNRFFVALHNCFKRNRFIKREKPDSVLIQATMAAIDCHFLKSIKKRAKIFLVVHDVIVPTESISWNMRALKKMYREADGLIVHSKTNKRQLTERFHICEDKIKVIPHGVKSTYNRLDKAACRQELHITENKPLLLFYGGIRKSKGLDVLINSLVGVDCILIIAGKPPYGESFEGYKEQIVEKRIKTVEYIEFTEDEFRDILFQASDYLVLPYKEFYSQSGVFMQAIQYHLPIIATDVSSFREYIEDYGLGFVAEPNNADSLHDAIIKAITTKRDYEKNMNRAVSENCWEVAGKMYADVLKVGKNV